MRLSMLLAVTLVAATAHPQCSITLSDSGIIHLQSGQQRTVTWNTVPGATSYFVEDIAQSLGEPSAPDFAFGGAYSESRNGESPNLTAYPMTHTVLYKMTFRLRVTALNRSNPAWVPCSADAQYVFDADPVLASIASRRILPIVGKMHGMNGSDYTTALVIAGAGIATPSNGFKLYQGKIVFRPLGTRASDNDPSVDYALNGDETILYDDIMATLGATGIGTLEVIPKAGLPTPLADAIIDNRLPGGKLTGVRIPALLGRGQLTFGDTVTVGIHSTTETRLSVGVRAYGAPGSTRFEHHAANGTLIETADRFSDGDTTVLFALHDIFPNVAPGDRVIAHFQPLPEVRGGSNAVVLFLTETGNDLNNPNVVYRDSLDYPPFSRGFEPFLVR